MQRLSRTGPPVHHPAAKVVKASAGIGAQESATIVAVALRDGNPGVRTAGLEAALAAAFATEPSGPRMVLLPGWARGWPIHDRVVVDVCKAHRAAVLFERCEVTTGTWTAYDGAGNATGTTIKQILASSGQADREPHLVDELLNLCSRGGERTVRLAGVDVGLLCCGENNVLRCEQAHGNRVSVRHHPKASLFEHVAVTLNGSHSNMGNWNKLNKRFEYLSRGRRLAFYVTNNSCASWRGAVRVYYDGALVADGGGLVGVAAKDLRLRVIEDDGRDRFHAVVVTVAGNLLQPR